MAEPSIKKNLAFRIVYNILTIITPLITAPYVSRVLGGDGVGVYSYTQSIATYFTMFAALGTAEYGAREIARCRDDKEICSNVFWEIEFLTIITSAISLLVWIVLILIDKTYSIYFLALTPAIIATAADISWLYTGIEKIHYTVIWNMICKILGVLGVLLIIKSKDDLTLYIFMMSIITLIGNLSMWLFLKKEVNKPNFKTIHVVKHFKETLKYFITSVAISVYTVLDKTMIGVLTKDSFQNGYYEQANKIINLAKTFAISSINSTLSPRMSYLFSNGEKDEINRRINNSLDLELLLSIGSCFGIIGIAKNFVPWFFGDGYEPVITLLYLMAPLIPIISFSTCLGSHFYVPDGRVMQSTRLTIVGSIVNICINAPLILLFGANGAVMATLIAETVISILYVHYSEGYMNLATIIKLASKKLLAGVIMTMVVIWLGNYLHGNITLVIFAQIFVGLIVYGLILLILKDESTTKLINIIKEKGQAIWQKQR